MTPWDVDRASFALGAVTGALVLGLGLLVWASEQNALAVTALATVALAVFTFATLIRGHEDRGPTDLHDSDEVDD